MFALTAAKWIGGFIVGAGAKQIASTIVKNATPEVTHKALKVGYKVVSWLMIGGLAKVAVDEYVDIIDRGVNVGKTIKGKINKIKEDEKKKKVAEEAAPKEA